MIAETAETSPSGANGANHDADGRFCVGNKAGKGNPQAKRMHQLKAVQAKATTPARMARVWDKVLSMVEAGDMIAAKLALEMVYGKAPQHVELRGGNGASVTQKESFDHAGFAQLYMSERTLQIIAKPPEPAPVSAPPVAPIIENVNESAGGSIPKPGIEGDQ